MSDDVNDRISTMEESMKEKQKSLDDIQRKFSDFMTPKGIEKTKFGDAVILANNVLMINCGYPEAMKKIIGILKK